MGYTLNFFVSTAHSNILRFANKFVGTIGT